MEFVLLTKDTILDYSEEVADFDVYYSSGEYDPASLGVNVYMSLEEFMSLPATDRMIEDGRPIVEVNMAGEKKWLYVYLKPYRPALLQESNERLEGRHSFSPFVSMIHRLRYIPRWSLMRNYEKENVAEHSSFMVAIIAHMLVTIGKVEFDRYTPQAEDVALAALFHDGPELLSSDIPSPVKKFSPEMLEQCRILEQLAGERIISMLPEKFRPVYEPLIHQRDLKIKKYVKAADLLDAYLKASNEVESGNRDFIAAKRGLEKKIIELQMEEVEFFMEVFAPAFSMTIDEFQF